MRIAIFGAGAVGGYFGGRLAAAGESVCFIARGDNLRALRESGLQVDSVLGDFKIYPVNALDDLNTAGKMDVIFLAGKTWQVTEMVRALRPMLGAETLVIPLQNGIEAPYQVETVLGKGKVCIGLVYLFSELVAPGHIVHSGGPGLIRFGEMDNRKSPRLERLRAAFQNARVAVEIPDDIHAAAWEKFLFLVSFAGVGAVSRAPIGVLRSLPETRALFEQSMREIWSLARKRGVVLPADVIDRTMAFVDAQPAAGLASMQRDILNGKPSELEALTGSVVRMAEASQMPVPLNQFIYHSLLPQEMAARGVIDYSK